MFYVFAGCTVACFFAAMFFRSETKGKTLEEIEEHFEGRRYKIVQTTFYPQESI